MASVAVEISNTSPQSRAIVNIMSAHEETGPTRSSSILSAGGGGGGDDAAGDNDESNQRRSERKRMREKQRRSDLSSAFEELGHFISQVEPQGTEEEVSVAGVGSDKKKRRKSSMDGAEDSGGITRLDLIGRAVRIMKRLHRENEERKRIIASYEARGGGQQPSDNVIVMVPSLTPVAEDHPVARASYPPSAYPQTYHHHSPASAHPYHPLSSASAGGIPVDPRVGYDMSAAAHLQQQQQHPASAYHMGYGRPHPPPGLGHPPPHYMGMQQQSPQGRHQLPRSEMSPTSGGLPPQPPPHPGGQH